MPRQGRLVSVLGLMCPSQHAICHAHQKLHNPSAGCLFLENGAGGTSREWRVRLFFSALCFLPAHHLPGPVFILQVAPTPSGA